MGESTAIAWTDHTFNPWWGCTRVSPGCQHCYAETFAKRTGHRVWGTQAGRRFFGDKHWAEPLKWDRQAEAAGRPHLVFCASMADVFEDRPELGEPRDDLFDLIAQTPHLIWQLLTKRPENVLRMVPDLWLRSTVLNNGRTLRGWPANAWVGTTVEDQQRADERIPELLRIPAPVRFLSCEPLLGPVDLTHLDVEGRADDMYWINALTGRNTDMGRPCRDVPTIGWVIAGGESGPGHRPLNVGHARALRDQCATAGVPFFFKQHGGRTPTAGGDLLDGRQHKAFPAEARR